MFWLEVFLRILGFGILFVSGTVKMFDRDATYNAIAGTRVLPRRYRRLIAKAISFLLPPWEILLAATMLTSAVRLGAIAACITSVVFAAYLGVAYLAGERGECGCFGTAMPSRISIASILRAAGMVLMFLLLFFETSGKSITEVPILLNEDQILLSILFALLIVLTVLVTSTFGRSAKDFERTFRMNVHVGDSLALSSLGINFESKSDSQSLSILLTSSSCPSCNELSDWINMANLRIENLGYLHLGAPDASHLHPIPENNFTVSFEDAKNSLGSFGTPALLEVDLYGTLLSEPIVGADAIPSILSARLAKI